MINKSKNSLLSKIKKSSMLLRIKLNNIGIQLSSSLFRSKKLKFLIISLISLSLSMNQK